MELDGRDKGFKINSTFVMCQERFILIEFINHVCEFVCEQRYSTDNDYPPTASLKQTW